jgi:hypothetical protein
MTGLLLGLLLCWDPVPEPNVAGYHVVSAAVRIEQWIECPCPDVGVPCLIEWCPVYTPFRWEGNFVTGTTFARADCAEEVGSACYFLHPATVVSSGLRSSRPEITAAVWQQGGCP